MKDHFKTVKNYLITLNYNITHENESEGILVINHEEEGIKNLIIGCANPILIIEQFIFELNNPTLSVLKSLLKKNRDMVHGAFVLDQTGTKVIFRDTLQVENLDLNELEASINALSLVLSEYTSQILQFAKH